MYRDEHDAAVLRAQALYDEALELGLEDAEPVAETASTETLVSKAERLERVVWRKRVAMMVAASRAERASANEAPAPKSAPAVAPRVDQVPKLRSPSDLGAAIWGVLLKPILVFASIATVATLMSMLESLIDALHR